MNPFLTTRIAALAGLLLPGLAWAATPVSAAPSSLATSQNMVMGTGAMSPLAILAATNRARVLGDKVDGAGTRYFCVTDSDLAKLKDPNEILQRLQPKTVGPQDGVRRVEVVVDLKRPLFLTAPMKTNVDIGTVNVDPSVHNIEVQSSLFVSQLTVVGK